MPAPSWNDIHQRAIVFTKAWTSASREQADKQTFWNEFFEIFGIPRKTVASFEEPVRKLRGTYGFIDLLWKGKVLIEHKSAGEDLDQAAEQAFEYIQNLLTVGRGDEAPRYVLISDFQRFALYDLDPEDQLTLPLFRNRRYSRSEFVLANLPDHIREFAFIPNYQVPTFKPQDPLNLRAVEIMAGVHDTLKAGGYSGHDLERFLVRVLFCLFAEDTHIFEPEQFRLYIENRTHPDGSDLGSRLAQLFAVLDTPKERRQKNLDEDLLAFEYINGELFRERLDFAAFTGPMRQSLLNACNFNWSRISPAIFGALFQEVMKPRERRSIGAHYTSERDILKVIHPLFLDALRAEFEVIQKDRSGRRANRLEDFRQRLTKLKFLDPACGCGNFLVIAYRELRALELEVLLEQHGKQQALTLDKVNELSKVDVHQFYGIEIEEWPARIAEVALWLMDHQSNQQILEAFSQPYNRLPLKNSPHILVGNALRTDWNDLLPAAECSYILGNPPFIGKKEQSPAQKADLRRVLGDMQGAGTLDYVSCWYVTALSYASSAPAIEVGFVSTNSITQGEQVSVLWGFLLDQGLKINFAYRTFGWESEARGKAHVHCVIIGFSLTERQTRVIFESKELRSSRIPVQAVNINPYLVDAPSVLIRRRTKALSACLPISKGSEATDFGHLILNHDEKLELIRKEPQSSSWLKPLLGGEELLNGIERWCLWLVGISPAELNDLGSVRDRVEKVRLERLASDKVRTQTWASYPTLFSENRQPTQNYIAIPKVSSERRTYLPLMFASKHTIASGSVLTIQGAGLYEFGVLSSAFHASWMRAVCGRMKSDYQYSASIVYNNFIWPQVSTGQPTERLVTQAQAVLDARALYPNSTLGQLYDPLLMPPELTKAHQRLDRAVEKCYRPEPFASDRERVEFLFALYERLTAPLLPAIPARRRTRTAAKA